MKKIFRLCLAGALATAAVSCNDDDDKGGENSGKMAINGQTEIVQSAFYKESAATETKEAEFDLYLFMEAYSQFPTEEPSFYVNIEASESLYGKTVDLTKPLDQSKKPNPYLYISTVGDGADFQIEYIDNKINASLSGEIPVTISSGTLTATRNGDKFTIKLSAKLSNGNSVSADWEGTATKKTL